jgi:hypothetical protein
LNAPASQQVPKVGAVPEYVKLTLNPSQTDSNFLYYSPSEIRQIYDATPLYKEGYDGRGMTISIVDAYGDPYIAAELKQFDQTFGIAAPPSFNVMCVDGPCNYAEGIAAGWNAEIALDVEWAHAMAPGANICLWIGANNAVPLYYAVAAAVAGRDPGTVVPSSCQQSSVVSMSWGEPENDIASSAAIEPTFGVNYPWLNQVFQYGTSKGITFFSSSGDWGAYDQSFGQTSPYGGTVFPASDPFVTSVGGTSLYMSTSSGLLQYSLGATANAIGSYGYETAWSWNNYYNWGTGGGFSTFYNRPSWQGGPGFPAGETRGVPDVAWDADPITGVLVSVEGQLTAIGGTSVGAPSWAGSMALIDSVAGHSLGLINPELYSILRNPSEYASAFHDVTVGDNNPDMAAHGWDDVTGMGSPNIANLASILVSSHMSFASSGVGSGSNSFYARDGISIFDPVGDLNNLFTVGSRIPIQVIVTSPDGARVTSGTFRATIYSENPAGPVVGSVPLVFNSKATCFFSTSEEEPPFPPFLTPPSPGCWEGTFTVPRNVIQGPVTILVSGSDSHGRPAAPAYAWGNIGLEAITTTDSPTYVLGNTILIGANIYNPTTGVLLTSGSYRATIWDKGSFVGVAKLAYSTADGFWLGTFTTTRHDPTGFYNIVVSGTDGHGNVALGETVVRMAPVSLSVAFTIKPSVAKESTNTIIVSASVAYPNHTPMTVGSVDAFLEINSTFFYFAPLTYNAASGTFVGLLPVHAENVAPGSYPIVISAFDPWGNSALVITTLSVVK